MVSERLVRDPSLLSHCHELRRLDLGDNLRSYDVREIQSYKPCQLPGLSELFLAGTPGLAFHPDTLHSTKALKTLVLGSHDSFNQSFLPSVHRTLDTNHTDTVDGEPEVEWLALVRPQWTWDWQLAHLETLDLSVEFALHFQFRMLQSTPSLQKLYLTIFSNIPALERVLTDADFTLPPGAPQSAGSSEFLPPQELDKIPAEELGEILCHVQCLKHSIEYSQEAPQEAPQRHWMYTHPQYMKQQQIHDRNISELNGLVAASPVLKCAYATLMAARARYYEKQATQDDITAVFQSEHPDRLVVPSLKTLELNGRWVVSDDVLETMLGQVFVKVESVDLFGCEGFRTRTWVRATAAMPFLRSAGVNRALEAEIASNFGLQSREPRGPMSLFEIETHKRLDYTFLEGCYSFPEANTEAKYNTKTLHFNYLQFRMLQGTPILQTLRLVIFSTTMPTVEQILTESDFTMALRALSATSSSPKAFDPHGIPHDELYVSAGRSDNADTEGPFNDAEQLQERLHHLAHRHSDYMDAFSGRLAAAAAVREVFERHCRGIEAITVASPICRRVYETLLDARVRYYRKKSAQAVTATAMLWSEQPERRLVVPSLRILEPSGRWVVTDDVLKVMLGKVFENLETVDKVGFKAFGRMHGSKKDDLINKANLNHPNK
ncbi:hypothetical protein BGZ93_004809 [Podila epicladia]|nr:hypothetical protein BGZ93_004809 [Podila epicladia]